MALFSFFKSIRRYLAPQALKGAIYDYSKMLLFFQKIKTLSAQKIAPPFKITVNSALESKSIKAQLSLEKEINIISFLVKFLCLLKLDNKSAFLEGFGELFSKCYEFLDFPSFDNFEEVTSFPSI